MVESTASFRPCVVVPVFDHEHALPRLVDGLRASGLTCWLVDDGSGPACAAAIDALAAAESAWLRVERLAQNRGKGVAVLAGFRAAQRAGFTHAVQIDADCQHDPRDIPRFVAAARAHPGSIINGVPQYDASVPKARYYGRYITNVLVWLYTLSLEIRDSMCGFRIYPLAVAVALDDAAPVGRRMQFDTDIIVRMFWSGVRVVNLETPVTYPIDGVSHFDLLRDNLRMAGLHLRLAAGFVRRLPVLLARRLVARSDGERG
ncbi:MAG TPA: glycosyltransferase family 2 protein [Burkholderiaceae bacterium]|nr:glycosyltransferase family 2 protein [Burkholderiaceae bacterium]